MCLGGKVESSGSDCDSNLDSELSSNSLSAHYQAGKSIVCNNIMLICTKKKDSNSTLSKCYIIIKPVVLFPLQKYEYFNT